MPDSHSVTHTYPKPLLVDFRRSGLLPSLVLEDRL